MTLINFETVVDLGGVQVTSLNLELVSIFGVTDMSLIGFSTSLLFVKVFSLIMDPNSPLVTLSYMSPFSLPRASKKDS